MAKKSHGKTADGAPITEVLVERLAAKAEAGYDLDDTLRRRAGRPPIGSRPATVESVRVKSELRQALGRRVKRDRETPSAVSEAGEGVVAVPAAGRRVGTKTREE